MILNLPLPLTCGVACASALASAAPAQTPRTVLPREIQQVIAEAVATCRSEGGRLAVRPGYLSRADFNGDGRADYILSDRELTCSNGNASSGSCGSRGCNHTILISRGAGFYPRTDVVAHDTAIERTGGRTLLLVNKEAPDGGTRWGWQDGRFDVLPHGSATRSSPAAQAGTGRSQAPPSSLFPFPVGIYTSASSCSADSGGLVEFFSEGYHHWEADQSTSFVRRIEKAPGKFSIAERFNSDEGGDPIETVEYERIGAQSFRRISFQRWDDRLQKMVPGREVETYRFCRPRDPQ